VDDQALRRYLGVARRWWWLMLLGAVLPMAVSYYLTSRQPDLYQAKATVMVGSSLQSVSPSPGVLTMSGQLAQAYAELAKRRIITEAVAQRLGLDMSPGQLARQMTVRVQAQLQLIEITVADSDPQWAAAIANAVALELVQRSPGSQQDGERRAFSERQLRDVRAKIEEMSANLSEQQHALADMTSAAEIADAEERMVALERVRVSYQTVYASLLQSLITEQTPNVLTIMEPATEPAFPVARKTRLIVAVAGMAGVVLAFSGVMVIEFLEDRIRWEGPAQETVLGLPVLGEVPDLSPADGPLVIRKLPGSSMAESVRQLRTAILLATNNRSHKVLLFTSAAPQEGKSLVVANLAAAMAESGRRTILVNADLRKRQLYKLFAAARGPGLIEFLGDSSSEPEAFIQQTSMPNLRLFRAGRQPSNPTSLLTSSRFAVLLEKLKRDYDVILVDSPAALVVPDATILATLVDAAILVVDATITSRRAALRAKRKLELEGKSKLLGVVINRASQVGNDYRGYYYRRKG